MIGRRAVLNLVSGVVLLVAGSSAVRAAEGEWATDSPATTIATLQRGLVELARERPTATLDERDRALEPLIEATHNLPFIAEFALRRQWGELTEAERQAFVTAFTRLSVMTYAARFAGVGADTFRTTVAGDVDAAGRAQVSTAVARPGQADVTLEYLLQRDATGWRIINIVADGVSDLALKRAEYQRVFAAGALDGLLAEIDAQVERLRQN